MEIHGVFGAKKLNGRSQDRWLAMADDTVSNIHVKAPKCNLTV